MDLSKISTADLQALQAGDLARVSVAGLQEYQRQVTAGSVESKPPGRQPDAFDNPNMATEGMGTLDRVRAGAGKALADTGRSLAQLARYALPNAAADSLGLPTQSDIDQAAQEDRALMRTTAGTVGNIGGQVALALAPAAGGLTAANKAQALWKAGGALNVAKSLGLLGAEGAAQNVAMNPRTSDDSLAGQVAGGAALGAVAQPLTAGASRLIQYGREAMRPAGATGRVLAQAGQDAPAALASAIRTGNREIVPGSAPTVAQAAQGNAGLAQLTRTVRNQGSNAYEARMAAQNEARMVALKRAAPGAVGLTSQDAAENFGRTLVDEAGPRYAQARKATSAAYESVDPFGEARLVLPADQADAVAGKYFGPGAGPMPGDLSALLDDVRTLGQVVEAPRAPGVALQAAGGLRPSASKSVDLDRDTLDVAVRKLGGVNIGKGGGELKWLRESDLGKPSVVHGPLARRDGGMDWDAMAQRVHGLGYIDEPDPRLLLDKLAESARGAPVMSMHGSEEALAASRGYYADMPDEMLKPTVSAGAVDYRTTQALRSRAGELAYKYGQSGDKRAASVAQAVRDRIDAALEDAAGRAARGEAGPAGEFFTPDMAQAVRAAKAARTDQGRRFETGPAAALWRNGPDGAPMAQGAEVARRFVNGGGSQVADAQQLRKMVSPDGPSVRAAQDYAFADLLQRGTTRSTGADVLSATKVDDWQRARSGALRELLTDDQGAALRGVTKDLQRAAQADSAGRAIGSNTDQNALNQGLLDGPISRLATGVPLLKDAVTASRDYLRRKRAEEVARVLLDPEEAARALLTFEALQRPNLAQRGLLATTPYSVPLTRGAYGLLTTD